jgi:hypothetical protein
MVGHFMKVLKNKRTPNYMIGLVLEGLMEARE